MTTTKRILATVAAVATAAGLTITALGAQGRAGRGGPFGPGPLTMLQRLDPTDAQKEQVKAIIAEERQQAPDRRLGELQRELQAAVMADVPDAGKIDEIKTAIGAAEASALNRRVDLQLKIAQILTPEQRQKAREMPAWRGGPGRDDGDRARGRHLPTF